MLEKRLWGVKLIGLLNLVFGIIGIIFYFFVLFYVPLKASQISGFKYDRVWNTAFQHILSSNLRTFEFFTVFGEKLFSASLAIITGIGVINLKNWARRIFIISSIAYAVGSSIVYLFSCIILGVCPFPLYLFLLKFIILVIVVFYLTRPYVKEQFE